MRKQVFSRLLQDLLSGEAFQLHFLRDAGREFNEQVIEKWYAALDGSGHAHVVLLHQQFDQVRFDVGV